MKILRFAISLITIMLSLNIFSKTPDFAYPQTVSKDASKDLEKALKDKNAHAALNAFIRYYVAQSQIDMATQAESIKRLESITQDFKEDSLAGIFYALQADLYYNFYAQNSWKYDRREIPLTPVPDDITEWSGDIFKAKINDLIASSIFRPQILATLPIEKYSDIIESDEYSAYIYPTLLDFVCCNAVSLNDRIGEGSDTRYVETGISYSPNPLVWETQKIQNTQSKVTESLKKLYLDNINNPKSAYVLFVYCNCINEYGVDYRMVECEEELDSPAEEYDQQQEVLKRKAWAIQQIDDLCIRDPKNPFAKELDYTKQLYLAQYVNATFDEYVAINSEFEVKLSVTNASAVDVEIYQLPFDFNDNNTKALDNYKPIKTVSLDYDNAKPFIINDTIKLTLNAIGKYAIVPKDRMGKISDNHISTLWVIDAMPAVFTNARTNYAVVADAMTGAPQAHRQVAISYDKRDYISNPTDKSGITNITNTVSKTRYGQGRISLVTNKGNIEFGINAHIHRAQSGRNTKNARVLTDRSIYRPGDEINVMAILSCTESKNDQSKQSLLKHSTVKLTLRDANWQILDTINGKTDQYGRFVAKFTAPTDGLTGSFTIQALDKKDNSIGSITVEVAEYKMPDFYLSNTNVARNTPVAGSVTITGIARMYSGMPLANADIAITISSSSFYRWFTPEQKIWSTTVKTDDNGKYTVVVGNEVFKGHEDAHWFTAQMDASSPTGTSAQATQPFSLGKPYAIMLSSPGENVDGALPFKPQVSVYGPDGEASAIALCWQLRQGKIIVSQGDFDGTIDLTKVTPGDYTLEICPKDIELADCESCSFTIFNRNTDIVPGDQVMWIESREIEAKGNKASISYGITSEKAYLYYAIGSGDSIMNVNVVEATHGYHSLEVNIPKSIEQAELYLLVIQNCKSSNYNIHISSPKPAGLTIVAESFRDKLIPGSDETWTLQVRDAQGNPIEAAIAIDMYNKALDALIPHRFDLFFPRYASYISLGLSAPYQRTTTNSFWSKLPEHTDLYFGMPEFYFYGQYVGYYIGGRSRSYNAVLSSSGSLDASPSIRYSKASVALEAEMCEDAAIDDLALAANGPSQEESENEGTQQGAAPDDFEYREASVPLGLWAPSLSTDKSGNITYTFKVPNAVTTWRMNCLAWSQEMEVGKLIRDLVANKPVMAQANAPRFLRAGDRAQIVALVMNNSERSDSITSVIEIFNPLNNEIIKRESVTQVVDSMQSASVSIEVYADASLSSIGYRIRSTIDVFTDGEQSIIPILSSMAQLIETEPFYLNPGDTSYTTMLPNADDARISLTFSENPAWSVVSALPGLRAQMCDNANSAAAALFSAALSRGIINDNPNIAEALRHWIDNPSDSMLVSMLAKNEDLKIALLNSTPWVQASLSDSERMTRLANIFDSKQIESTILQAIDILQDLQRHDGGLPWGKWCDESSIWVTGNVLEGLAYLKAHHWLPENKDLSQIISKALNYYDNAVSKLYPGQKKLLPDMLYSYVRPQFDQQITARGKEVIEITINDIEKHWKGYSDPAQKSEAAEILWLNGRQSKARQLMASVDEFGVFSQSQGVRFPRVNSLAAYAIILEAYSMIDPASKYVDALRQQLIIRKQGTDWGSAVVTSQVVAGILSCGSQWNCEAKGATIMVADTQILPSLPIEKYTGSLTADLSQYPGQTLNILTPGSGPAYGAVYAQFKQAMYDVDAYACDDLSITKHMTVRRGTAWEMIPDTLKVGDRVKIQLTIHCKRNLDYVTIVDERAACFEPVDQIPGWLWSEGTAFYRENRDASTNLFVISLRPGTYLLTYEMNVSNAGAFSSGVATIQSQYAPEISAHSQGNRLDVNPK